MSNYELNIINNCLEDWQKSIIMKAYEDDEKVIDTNGMIVPKWQILLERFYNA